MFTKQSKFLQCLDGIESSLKIANFFFEPLLQLLCLVPLKRYIPIKSLYPIHTDRLYPWRQRTGLVPQPIHTLWQVIPLASDTIRQVSLYWCCSWRASRGARSLGAVRCVLSQWAAHCLRILRQDHSNVGCRDWCCSWRAYHRAR